MKYIKLLFLTFFIFIGGYIFAVDEMEQAKDSNVNIITDEDGTKITVTEKEEYEVQLKNCGKDYPYVLYVVFKDYVPLLDEIRKILKNELLSASKTIPVNDKTVIIASAWFDNQISNEIEKIELSTSSSSFVWVADKEEKKPIKSFTAYIKYLKEKIRKEQQNELQANIMSETSE